MVSWLNPYRVIDLSGRLGWLAGRILADLGADVIKVESPDTDLGDTDWRAFNVNKRVLRLDVTGESGRRVIERAIAAVDVLIETATPGDTADDWLAADRVAGLNPDLVHVSVTPFGRSGPKACWRATDLEMMAASGALSLAGKPRGTPLRISVPQSYSWAAAHAASGALLALFHRARGGGGQHVDVCAQASLIAALAHAPTYVEMLGTVPSRAGSHITGRSVHGANYRAFWTCRDGYINFVVYGGPAGKRTNKALVEWMRKTGASLGALETIDWDDFDPKMATQEEVDRIEEPIAVFFQGLTKQEFLNEACKREMLGYPVSTVADIATDPQLSAREFWQDLPSPDGGLERHCGVFHLANGVRPSIRYPAGEIGCVTRDILKDLGYSDGEIDELGDRRVVRAA